MSDPQSDPLALMRRMLRERLNLPDPDVATHEFGGSGVPPRPILVLASGAARGVVAEIVATRNCGPPVVIIDDPLCPPSGRINLLGADPEPPRDFTPGPIEVSGPDWWRGRFTNAA